MLKLFCNKLINSIIKNLNERNKIKIIKILEFWPINGFFRFFISRLSNGFIEIKNNKLFFDPYKYPFWYFCQFRTYDYAETCLIERELKEGDIFLDIGANLGYYTLLSARLVGNKGKVFAFEPDPENFIFLKKNVEGNRYKNVTLEQKAVSDKNGFVKFCISRYHKGQNYLYTNGVKLKRKEIVIDVEAINLDYYLIDKCEKIDFVKIDIEGHEPLVIKGMNRILNTNKNIKILTEFDPTSLSKRGFMLEEYLLKFIEDGFSLFQINRDNNKLDFIDIKEIKKFVSLQKNSINIFCTR